MSSGSIRTRSPASQRASWRARRSATSVSSGCFTSGMVADLQAEMGRHPIQGAVELLPQGVGLAADLGRDLGPFQPLGAMIGEDAFLVGQQPAHLLEQVAPGDDVPWLQSGAGEGVEVAVGLSFQPALVALLG